MIADIQAFVRMTLKQRFLWAMLLFGAISVGLSFFHVASIKPQETPGITWTSSAVEAFEKDSAFAPPVVFLGSSLMLTPLSKCDAYVIGRTLDACLHHESVYFSQLVKQITGQNIQTFNFALPGEMPSDAFLITKLLLRGNKRPKMIIYGVGPRDFMDNLLDSPSATDPYRYLSIRNDQQIDSSYVGGSWDKQINYWLTRLVYAYGKKERLSTQVELALRKIIDQKIPRTEEPGRFTYQLRHTLCPNYRPMAIEPGECLFKPGVDLGDHSFKSNLEEYRKRYGTLKWDTFLTQLQFLAKLLDIARQRHIEPVLVAMPITTINRSLIPDNVWNTYKYSLKVIAQEKGARFIDLEMDNQFDDRDFDDTVHLNTAGGVKLIQLLAADLWQTGNEQVASQSNKQLAKSSKQEDAPL